MFNPIKYFESREIDYHLPPEKNVTRGWININCFFPGCDDRSWHCGIHVSRELFNCYICGEHGSVVKLIQEIEDCSYGKALKIFEDFSGGSFDADGFGSPPFPSGPPLQGASTKAFKYPKGMNILKGGLDKRHISYLTKRRFDYKEIEKRYKIKGTGNVGRYKFRIIIPIFQNRQLISFTSRDVTGLQEPKYLHCPIELSVTDPKRTLYNIDSVKDSIVLTEGVFDAWRIGDGAVATFGTTLTSEQLELVYEKQVKSAFVLFDSDAKAKARKLGKVLASMIRRVEVISVSTGDPADLTDIEVRELKRIMK